MKKSALIFLVFCSITAFSQKSNIGINKQFRGNDTTYTFSLLQSDLDLCIEKLIVGIGEPAKQSIGNIVWLNIEIDGIEGEMQIHLKDGVFEITQNGDARFHPFITDEEKNATISKTSDKKYRLTEIEFTDNEGNNLINSASAKDAVLAFLNALLIEVE